MDLLKSLKRQFTSEAVTTRKMLSRIPEDKYDWKPHAKNMTLLQLATHVADLPEWIKIVHTTKELDFEKQPYSPPAIKNNRELMEYFENNQKEGMKHLDEFNDGELSEKWILRSGEQIFGENSKEENIWMAYCQTVHHRAQLGLYLRLLDVPIPGSYGPSADEAW